jgi:hypothetical protein
MANQYQMAVLDFPRPVASFRFTLRPAKQMFAGILAHDYAEFQAGHGLARAVSGKCSGCSIRFKSKSTSSSGQ